MIEILHHRLSGMFLITALLFLSAHSAAAAPEPVGKVVFVEGQVMVQRIAQPEQVLQKNDPLYNHDKILTGEGRVQIRFIDESFVSVQPGSSYQIENFQYDEADDSKLSAVFRLVRGGLRAVTGLVADRKKDAYKVHTPIATIGVRGTAHNTRLCQGDCPGKEDGLYHNTWTGITYVTNDQGSRDVPAGKAVYVRDKDAPIQELEEIPSVVAIQGTADSGGDDGEDQDPVFQAGEQLNETGDEVILGDQLELQVNFVRGLVGVVMENINDGQFFNTSVLLTEETLILRDNLPIGLLATDVNGGGVRSLGTMDPDGVQAINDPVLSSEIDSILSGVPASALDTVRNDPASLAEYETSSGTAWGRWADGHFLVAGENGYRVNSLDNNQSVHFVTGPAPETVPEMGSARYAFIGGTRSTSADGQTIGQGVIDGFIDVSFWDASADLDMLVRHGGTDFDVTAGLSITGTQITTDFAFTSPGSLCVEACSADINGQFMGPNLDAGVPRDAGINYEIIADSSPSDNITGVAAFRTDGTPILD